MNRFQVGILSVFGVLGSAVALTLVSVGRVTEALDFARWAGGGLVALGLVFWMFSRTD